MRAVVIDPQAPLSLRLGEAPDPEPGPGQVLIDVRHFSINYGELNAARRGALAAGFVPGWDAAGVVAAGRAPVPGAGGGTATAGAGLLAGTRVVAMGGDGGAWAQRRAVDVSELAVVPDEVDLAVAATLPIAGCTALRALRAAGPILGRRVLVTGASGGVGQFAVQLAAAAGGYVLASVGSPARGAGLAALGAAEVVVGLDGIERPVDVVLDNVGGPTLVRAFELLAPGGSLQSIGWTSGEPAVFAPYGTVGDAKSLSSFNLGTGLAGDLATLLWLVARGRLRPEIGWRGPWDRIGEAAAALLDRRVFGKAVLDVEADTGAD